MVTQNIKYKILLISMKYNICATNDKKKKKLK